MLINSIYSLIRLVRLPMATPSSPHSDCAVSDGEDQWVADRDNDWSFARVAVTPRLRQRASMITLALTHRYQPPQSGQPSSKSTANLTIDAPMMVETATATMTTTATTTTSVQDRSNQCANSTTRHTNNDQVNRSYTPYSKETRTHTLRSEMTNKTLEDLHECREDHWPFLIKDKRGTAM